MEILVRRQQHQIVPPAELYEQGIDRSDLHAATAAGVPDFCCFDVVFPARLEEGESGEALDELGSRLGSGKALQKLLQYQTRGEYLIGPQQGMAECRHLGRGLLGVSAQSQRPDARVDEQAHLLRARSAL